jgi:bifunctional non-homologous end joining protein LigD
VTELRAGRRTVRITHPDKVLFPKDGITKLDLAHHYLAVAGVMVPHVRDRPMTQHRWPDGIGGQDFWHKQVPKYFPDWIATVDIKTEKGPQQQVLCNEAATLAYLTNQNCITPHVWTARAGDLWHPDQVMFDLDPPGDDFGPVRRGALLLKDFLEDLGLVPFVKTTGSKGLHIVVPLDRSASYEEVRSFADRVAQVLADRDPELTTEFRKNKRKGRVFVDTGRNWYGQTAVPPYAVRARDGAPVAVPLEWSEVRSARLSPRGVTLRTMVRRLRSRGDPWKGMGRRRRKLAPAARRLERAT